MSVRNTLVNKANRRMEREATAKHREAIQHRQELIREQAMPDALTGLPNRAPIEEGLV